MLPLSAMIFSALRWSRILWMSNALTSWTLPFSVGETHWRLPSASVMDSDVDATVVMLA